MRDRLFAALPEFEWPRTFKRSVARAWVKRISLAASAHDGGQATG